MPKLVKEWLDAAASVAGLVAGLPYEPLNLDAQPRNDPDAQPRNDNAQQLDLPLEAPAAPARQPRTLRRAA